MSIPSQSRPRMLTNLQRSRFFGAFKFRPAPTEENPEKIEFLDDWKAKNLVQVSLSALAEDEQLSAESRNLLKRVPPPMVWFHTLVAPHFEALLRAWCAAGLIHHIQTWNGSFAPRFKRGRAPLYAPDHLPRSLPPANPKLWDLLTPAVQEDWISRLSAHSWGTAFDINARWNPLGKLPARAGTKGSVLELVPVAESLGWVWGGRWTVPDGMHFERGTA